MGIEVHGSHVCMPQGNVGTGVLQRMTEACIILHEFRDLVNYESILIKKLFIYLFIVKCHYQTSAILILSYLCLHMYTYHKRVCVNM